MKEGLFKGCFREMESLLMRRAIVFKEILKRDLCMGLLRRYDLMELIIKGNIIKGNVQGKANLLRIPLTQMNKKCIKANFKIMNLMEKGNINETMAENTKAIESMVVWRDKANFISAMVKNILELIRRIKGKGMVNCILLMEGNKNIRYIYILMFLRIWKGNFINNK